MEGGEVAVVVPCPAICVSLSICPVGTLHQPLWIGTEISCLLHTVILALQLHRLTKTATQQDSAGKKQDKPVWF